MICFQCLLLFSVKGFVLSIRVTGKAPRPPFPFPLSQHWALTSLVMTNYHRPILRWFHQDTHGSLETPPVPRQAVHFSLPASVLCAA